MPSEASSAACCLVRWASAAFEARDRGDVDDGAAAGLGHQRGGELRHQEGPGEVDRHDAVPLGERRLQQRLEHGRAGIVDERIEPPEAGGQRREGRLDSIGIGDVAGQRQRRLRTAERGDGLRQQLALDVEQADPPALLEEAPGGGEPDAARGAGDESDLDAVLRHDAFRPGFCQSGWRQPMHCGAGVAKPDRRAPAHGRRVSRAARQAAPSPVWPAHSTENSVPNARAAKRDNGNWRDP